MIFMGIEKYPVPHKGKFAVWHPIKNYQAYKEATKQTCNEGKKSIKTDPEVIKMVN